MSKPNKKFWPFDSRSIILVSIIILAVLMLFLWALMDQVGWPSQDSEKTMLIGVLVFSLLPVILALMDVIVERGGVIKAGGVEIDFSKVPSFGASSITVPTNIGIPAQPVVDSSTTEILEALETAIACDVVKIDLEGGQAWWETRLLILLAGAVRLKKPGKVVFVAKEGEKNNCFQGWSHPDELFPLLLKSNPQYALSYHTAMAAAQKWKMIEPTGDPSNSPQLPYFQRSFLKSILKDQSLEKKLIDASIIKNLHYYSWRARFDESIENEGQLKQRLASFDEAETEKILGVWRQLASGGLADRHPGIAFSSKTGLPNSFLPEQLLALELGEKVESMGDPKKISIPLLHELFGGGLKKDKIEENWSAECQVSAFFASDASFLAVTKNGQYSTLISRLTVLSSMFKILIEKNN